MPIFVRKRKGIHLVVLGVFGTNTDFKLVLPRTEYHCARCGGSHGHI